MKSHRFCFFACGVILSSLEITLQGLISHASWCYSAVCAYHMKITIGGSHITCFWSLLKCSREENITFQHSHTPFTLGKVEASRGLQSEFWITRKNYAFLKNATQIECIAFLDAVMFHNEEIKCLIRKALLTSIILIQNWSGALQAFFMGRVEEACTNWLRA